MDDYQVAIPSYHRADALRVYTLALLQERGVPLSRVTVFLDEGDPHALDYSHLGVNTVTSPVKGINAQRRIISGHYPPGTPVVSLDDDITNVLRATDPKTLEPVDDLDGFFKDAFEYTRGLGLNVWGAAAVANPFFMTPGKPPTTNLKFLIATMWGYFSRPGHPVHDTTVTVKEDYEFSLRAWWYDGGVVRFNDITTKADHYKEPGGCQDYRTAETSAVAAAQLMEQWPGLVRVNDRRKSGHTEVLLARKARHGGNSVDTPPPGAVAV